MRPEECGISGGVSTDISGHAGSLNVRTVSLEIRAHNSQPARKVGRLWVGTLELKVEITNYRPIDRLIIRGDSVEDRGQFKKRLLQQWLSQGGITRQRLQTRNSAIADKPRDVFRGQSRSPNMVPFHMLGIVSY